MPKSSRSTRTIFLKPGLPFASIEELVAVNASIVLLSFCCATAVEAEPKHVAKTSVTMNVHESLIGLSFLRISVLLEVRPLLRQTLLPRGDHKPCSRFKRTRHSRELGQCEHCNGGMSWARVPRF